MRDLVEDLSGVPLGQSSEDQAWAEVERMLREPPAKLAALADGPVTTTAAGRSRLIAPLLTLLGGREPSTIDAPAASRRAPAAR